MKLTDEDIGDCGLSRLPFEIGLNSAAVFCSNQIEVNITLSMKGNTG